MAFADLIILILALIASGVGAILVVAWAVFRMINPEGDR